MSTLETYRLILEPDREFPRLFRLHWETVPVTIRDVLFHGVHPWSGPNAHATLPDALLRALNAGESLFAELEPFGYSFPLSVSSGNRWEGPPRFLRILQTVQSEIRFAEDMTYLELLDLAKEALRRRWNHGLARELLRGACPGFQEARRLLKRGNPRIKLASYDDLERVNLAGLLSLEDFADCDRLLIAQALPASNLRRTRFLERATDDAGRLRLVPEINAVSLAETRPEPDCIHSIWHAERHGDLWRLRPDIGGDLSRRAAAMNFAARWRTDRGRLCFSTTGERLVEMVETGAVRPSFPSLNYDGGRVTPVAAATVGGVQLASYRIGRHVTDSTLADLLRDLLRSHGVSTSGNKEQLLERLAALAADLYRERLPELDGYFSRHPLVRVQSVPKDARDLPLLQDMHSMRNLVLAVYAVRHLRGGSLLEASHENTAYTEEELALALMTGKVVLQGGFLPVV